MLHSPELSNNFNESKRYRLLNCFFRIFGTKKETMLPALEKIKGIHPGYILRRELESRGLKSSQLASSIDEHKQTISAILNRKRKITPLLSIKLSETLGVDQDYFMLLQASYEVNTVAKENLNKTKPNINEFRRILFWDTDINTIDWHKQKRAIIKRVLERGNNSEVNELISFYGKQIISSEIKQINNPRLARFTQNIILHEL